jgi:hypothetical protein
MQSTQSRAAAVVVASAMLSLAACTTPPARMTDDDFVMRSLKVDKPVGHVLSAFHDGYRLCGPATSTGLLSVTHHGAPNCGPPRPDGSTICDIYMSGSTTPGGRTEHVLGRVDFQPAESGTAVTLRVWKVVANKEGILGAWEKFLKGQAQQVCPSK